VTVQGLGYNRLRGLRTSAAAAITLQVEMADLFNVVCGSFTIGTRREAAEGFIYAFEELARDDRPLDMFAAVGDSRRAV